MTETQYQKLLDGLTQINLRLDHGLAQVNQRLGGVDHRLDGVDQRLGGIDQRLDGIDQRLDGVDQRLDGVDQRLEGVSQRLDGEDQRLEGINQRLDRMEETNREAHVETRRHFEVVAEHLEHKIGLVAEGLIGLEERFVAGQRQTAAEFVLVRSEIRLAYSALDQRISALENAAGA